MINRILSQLGELNNNEIRELSAGLGQFGDINLIDGFSNKGIRFSRVALIEGAIVGNRYDLVEKYMPRRLPLGVLFFYLQLSVNHDDISNYLFNYLGSLGYQLTPFQLEILLNKAARLGKINVIKRLIKQGPDEFAIGTAIGYAGVNKHFHIVDYLLTTQLVTPKALTQALFIAAVHNDSEFISWLQQHGANDINAIAYGAAQSGNLNLLLKALNEGATIEPKLFIIAAKWRHLNILKYLAEFFDQETFNQALIAAAQNLTSAGKNNIIPYLISIGANNLEVALIWTAKDASSNIDQLLPLLSSDQLIDIINRLIIINLTENPDPVYIKLILNYANNHAALDFDYVLDIIRNTTQLRRRQQQNLVDYLLSLRY